MSQSLRSVISKEILERIRTEEFPKDTLLTEAKVCDMFHLSRTPVREALIELTASGILEKVPRKGYKLREFDQKIKIDVYTVLADLDALAARLAVPYLTEDDLLRMSECSDLIDVAIKYKNYKNYCELQEKFHHIYIDKCNNAPLVSTLEDIKSSVTRYLYYTTDIQKLFEMCTIMNQEHRHIIEMFRQKKITELEDFLKYTHWMTRDTDMI